MRSLALALLLLILSPSARVSAQADSSDSLSVSFPGKAWAVKIDAPGFSVETNEIKPDGRKYLLASNPKTGLVLSVTLEATRGTADAKTCPGFLRQRVDGLTSLGPVGVKSSEDHSMAVIEYLIPKASGLPVEQKNFVLCSAKENVFIDVHLSKVQFQPSDESLFLEVLSRLQVEDGPVATSSAPGNQAAKTSLEYFAEGSRYYLASDFADAIGPYENALALEKKQRQMSHNDWRVLVDNLGMAYGIRGDLEHSEATLDYGISQDPDYPMFYYNLGCVAAERGDMHKAMDFLGKAFARKAHSIPGEGMPDPRQDDSFQRFMANDEFRKFVDALESPSR